MAISAAAELNALCNLTGAGEGVQSGFSMNSTLPTIKRKEIMSISASELNALCNLAGAGEKDEFSRYENSLPDNIKSALERKMLQRQEETALEAAESIVRLLDRSKEVIDDRVAEVRAIRRREKTLIGKIGEIERAKAYGLETNNFIPLMLSLDLLMKGRGTEGQQKLFEIPASFKPKATKKK